MNTNSSEKVWLARTRRRKRIVTICALIGIIWFPILVFSVTTLGAKTYGPYSDEVKTFGDFKPGGFINFKVTPNISSINGFFHATVLVEPVLGENIKEKGIKWPTSEKEVGFGWPWGESILVRKRPPFDFVVSQDIPKDSSLSGENIHIVFKAKIVYPVTSPFYSTNFFNKVVRINEEFDISIDGVGNPMSVWDRGWFIPCLLLWAAFGLSPGFLVPLMIWKSELFFQRGWFIPCFGFWALFALLVCVNIFRL